MRKRAQLVIKRHADHRKGVAEGKIIPWAELRAEWPKWETQVLNLQRSHAAMIAETDPKKRLPLSKAFFAALQPIGPFLQPATFRRSDLSLTPKQAAELETLEFADTGPALPDPKGKMLKTLTPTDVFTLIDLSIPIILRGPPETEIFLSAGGGGSFENGLPMQRIKTDKQGIAESSWVSRGDSIGLSVLTASTPMCINEINYQVEVVQLALIPLPELPSVTAQKVKNLKNKPIPKSPPALR